ncbi:hypothetical protein PVAP13_2NG116900 [Panicum virgatum]|uniref:Uncharacterized protein n=1 Tax=Panicum virgatum TaxID=38727 RepID=A0A8T0VPL9_PANVG|nr:hypothetical protein PVAP13_2NG116900 [Panicum virgatum]KAG2634474.1 hypothetical protein PVAP13_2NG116900 [Panicum virgatum]
MAQGGPSPGRCRGRALLHLRREGGLLDLLAASLPIRCTSSPLTIESVAAPLHRLLRLQHAEALPSERKGGATTGLPRSLDAPEPAPRGRPSHIQFAASSGSEPASPPASPPRGVPEQLTEPQAQAQYAYGYSYAPLPAYAYPPPQGLLQFYYARRRPPPASVAVTQRAPGPPQRVRYGSFDGAGGYPLHYAYGDQAPPPVAAALRPPPATAPPSPPKASSWDFLNVFKNVIAPRPRLAPPGAAYRRLCYGWHGRRRG